MRWWVVALSVLATGWTVEGTALDDYVNKVDPHYKWVDMNHTMNLVGAKAHVLNVTSQKWLTDADSDRSIWWHYLVVIIPDILIHKDAAFMYITGGSTHDGFPSATDEDILVAQAVAVGVGTVTATLFQIPDEPIKFPKDPVHKDRSEDAIIAYTWRHFLDNPNEPEWLLQLPMTKACVRGLDTLGEFVKKSTGREIKRYVVGGASKRGWATWLTAAVDKRIVAFIPIVMDLVNIHPNIHHMWRNYGGWSFAFKDYYAENFTATLDRPEFKLMTDIIDPFSYFDRYDIPKLVIDSADDEFFQMDDNYYWWDQLPGEKHLLMIQNAEHSMITGIPEILESVIAFSTAVLEEQPRPLFTWTIENGNETGTIRVKELNGQAHKVKVRYGETLVHDRRDFRWIIAADEKGKCPFPDLPIKDGLCLQPIIWGGEELTAVAPGEYVAHRAKPEQGWKSFFIEMYYKSPTFTEYRLTTQASIIPNNFPYPDCVGAACKGKLV